MRRPSTLLFVQFAGCLCSGQVIALAEQHRVMTTARFCTVNILVVAFTIKQEEPKA